MLLVVLQWKVLEVVVMMVVNTEFLRNFNTSKSVL